MGYQVVWTLRARQDLKSLVLYIARDKPLVAESFRQQILDKVERLQEFPEMGRVVPERQDSCLRELIHSPYRIVYRVKDAEKRVELLRVWHGARGEPEVV